MYQHIIGIKHRTKYLLQRNSKKISSSSSCKEVKAYAEKYEKENGRHVEQIKALKTSRNHGESVKRILPNVRNVTQRQKCKLQNSKKITKKVTKGSKILPEIQPRNGVSPNNEYITPHFIGSTCLNKFHSQSDLDRDINSNLNFGEYFDGHIVDAATLNITKGMQEDVYEFSEIADCSVVLDNEDTMSVISISSSTSSDGSLLDIEEEQTCQTSNCHFNSYDVALGVGYEDQQVSEENWNLTKMECLQLFMEKSEPLVVETQSQWELLVSVIQNVSEAVEKCNVQNLPP